MSKIPRINQFSRGMAKNHKKTNFQWNDTMHKNKSTNLNYTQEIFEIEGDLASCNSKKLKSILNSFLTINKK